MNPINLVKHTKRSKTASVFLSENVQCLSCSYRFPVVCHHWWPLISKI